MMPMMGVLRVWLRATNDGKLWLMWIKMSHQLMWLLTMPTGCACSSPPPLLLLPPLLPLPLPPLAGLLPSPSRCPTLIHVTRQKPHHQRHTRQCQLPSLATVTLRMLAGSRKLSRQHSQKLISASSAPVSLMGSTCRGRVRQQNMLAHCVHTFKQRRLASATGSARQALSSTLFGTFVLASSP